MHSTKEEKFSSIHKPVAVGSHQLLTVGTTHISKLTDDQLIKEFLSGSYSLLALFSDVIVGTSTRSSENILQNPHLKIRTALGSQYSGWALQKHFCILFLSSPYKFCSSNGTAAWKHDKTR